MKENEWIPLEEILKVVEKAEKNEWKWYKNPQCKYVDARIDMRDRRVWLADRDGNPITIKDLELQR